MPAYNKYFGMAQEKHRRHLRRFSFCVSDNCCTNFNKKMTELEWKLVRKQSVRFFNSDTFTRAVYCVYFGTIDYDFIPSVFNIRVVKVYGC